MMSVIIQRKVLHLYEMTNITIDAVDCQYICQVVNRTGKLNMIRQ